VNIHGVVSGVIAAVNPHVIGTVQVSVGTITEADGTQIPQFASFPGQSFQVQALSSGDLRKMDNVNLQAVMRAVYLNGNIEGLDRPAGKGGDVLIFSQPGLPNAQWLVTNLLEPWGYNGWCKVAVTLQVTQ